MSLNEKYKKGIAYGFTDKYLNKNALTAAPVVDSTAGTQYRGIRTDFAKKGENGLASFWNDKTRNDSSSDINTVYPMGVVGFPESADKNGNVKAGAGTVSGMSNSGGNSSNSGGSGGSYTVNAGNEAYIAQLNSLYDQIMNRKPFQYDLNGDLLYRQMADQYTQLGQQAMRDTMGQAAALTGGYGNSYANQVGNQAYQQYLTALNQNIPDLYDRAYNVWMNEGDRLLQQYELAAAHPGYVDALSPKTYYVPAAQEETSGTDASATTTDYYNFLNALIGSQTDGNTTTEVPFFNWYYKRDSQK